MNKLGLTIGFALSALAVTSSAHAEFIQFYQGNAASVPFDSASAQCPIGVPSCTSDVGGPSLQYATSAGTLTVTASTRFTSVVGNGTLPSIVLQDTAPRFGGLGVDTPGLLNPGDDSIGAARLGRLVGARERLELTFSTPVHLSHIVFWDENHGPSVNFHGGTFDLLVDGALVLDNQRLANVFNTSLTGTSFTFRPGTVGADFNESFYVGGANIAAVPLPGTLALLGAALAGMGFVRSRGQASSHA